MGMDTGGLHEQWYRMSKATNLAEFQAAVEELKQESAEADLHGTSLAWINVTMKCLKCHEWVRTVVLAGQETQP